VRQILLALNKSLAIPGKHGRSLLGTGGTMQAFREKVSLGRAGVSRYLIFATMILGSALLLQGCGGSGTPMTSASPSPTPTPPVTVTVTTATYPTVGSPFEAVPTSSGPVLVSVTAAGSQDGVQVFTPNGSGGLQSSCVNQLPASLLSENASPANLKLFPDGTGVGGGIWSARRPLGPLDPRATCRLCNGCGGFE
jgi:hypothetical protein